MKTAKGYEVKGSTLRIYITSSEPDRKVLMRKFGTSIKPHYSVKCKDCGFTFGEHFPKKFGGLDCAKTCPSCNGSLRVNGKNCLTCNTSGVVPL